MVNKKVTKQKVRPLQVKKLGTPKIGLFVFIRMP